MESQSQNPEFRNNPENFHLCIIRLTYDYGFNQGSNLALANLLNASSFSQKARNYHHLLSLTCKYKSFSHQLVSKLCINCLINSVDPD